MQFSTITVKGNVGSVEGKYTPRGDFVCEFSIAVNHKKREDEFTNWFKGTIWGTQGELFNNLVDKGTLVEVEGEFAIETWRTKEGEERTANKITRVYRFDICAKKKSGDGGEEEPEATPYD